MTFTELPTLPILGELEPETLKITVTGTRTERNVDEIPASITVFDLGRKTS